jgi:hypothetical protein
MQKNWYLRTNTQSEGPFSEPELRARLLANAFFPGAEVRQGDSEWKPASDVKQLFTQIYQSGWYVKTKGKTVGPFVSKKILDLHQSGQLPKDALLRQGTSEHWLMLSQAIALIEQKQTTLTQISADRQNIIAHTEPAASQNAPLVVSHSAIRDTAHKRIADPPQFVPQRKATASSTGNAVEKTLAGVDQGKSKTPAIAARQQSQQRSFVKSVPVQAPVAMPALAELPAVSIFDQELESPPYSNRRHFKKPALRRPMRLRPILLPISLVLAGLLLTSGIVFGIYHFEGAIRRTAGTLSIPMPDVSLASVIPLVDSPEKVLDDIEALIRRNQSSELTSDEFTIDTNFANIKRLTGELNALRERAAALGPLDEESFKSVSGRIEENVRRDMAARKSYSDPAVREAQTAKFAETLKKSKASTPAKVPEKVDKRQLQEDFETLGELLFASEALYPVIIAAWQPIPEPKSDIERIANGIDHIRRDVYLALLQVRNKRKNEDLIRLIENANLKFEKLFRDNETVLNRAIPIHELRFTLVFSDAMFASPLQELMIWQSLEDAEKSNKNTNAIRRFASSGDYTIWCQLNPKPNATQIGSLGNR